jgi:hypothetical protein
VLPAELGRWMRYAQVSQVIVRVRACIVSHFCLNCDFCIVSHVCIFYHMKRLARLAAIIILATAGLGLAHVTIATPAHAVVGGYATHGHGGSGCVACRMAHRR